MSRRHWHAAGAPGWWPAGEPWPPRGRKAWPGRRAGFIRRIAVAFGILLVMSAVGVNTLLTALLNRTGVDSSQRLIAILLMAGATVVLFLIAFLTTMRRVGFPLGDIVGAADRVAGGDFSVRVVERGPPALRSVARAFNGMTTRLEAHEQQRQQLMSDVAHELRTPLAVLQARLEGLVDGLYPRDEAQLKALLAETRTLARLVEDVRTLANAESGALSLQREPTDLAALIQEAADGAGAGDSSIAIQTVVPELPTVDVDPVRIREVLANLLSNAVRHSPKAGTVLVSATASSDAITVTVADQGQGIAAEELPRIFDRFYKGAASAGSGLGLTIARNLARAHGGELRAASEPGRGTTMTLTVPVTASLS